MSDYGDTDDETERRFDDYEAAIQWGRGNAINEHEIYQDYGVDVEPIMNRNESDIWGHVTATRNDLDDMMKERAQGRPFLDLWDRELAARDRLGAIRANLVEMQRQDDEWNLRRFFAEHPGRLQARNAIIPAPFNDANTVEEMRRNVSRQNNAARDLLRREILQLRQERDLVRLSLEQERNRRRRNGVAP